jgi:predicted NodU family carbamoyl transferase
VPRESGFDNVFISPSPGDEGIAVGCAMYGLQVCIYVSYKSHNNLSHDAYTMLADSGFVRKSSLKRMASLVYLSNRLPSVHTRVLTSARTRSLMPSLSTVGGSRCEDSMKMP